MTDSTGLLIYFDGPYISSALATGDSYVDNGDDCDDSDDDVWSGATEYCDGIDNNCSGDESDALDAETWYADFDGDGYGDLNNPITACDQPSNYVSNTDDCNDSEALAYTGAVEVCDGVDNDCNGVYDDGFTNSDYYPDADGDGYGDPNGVAHNLCVQVDVYVENIDVCDDPDNRIYTGAAEVCDGVDNDCDGNTDDGFVTTDYYPDADGDGYGNTGATPVAKLYRFTASP